MRSFASSIKQHETIRLDPDITRKIITSDGDVIIVIFDNMAITLRCGKDTLSFVLGVLCTEYGMLLQGRKCGY